MAAYTKEYLLWKGIRDEMIALKKAYGDCGVPKDIWSELESMCKEAKIALALRLMKGEM